MGFTAPHTAILVATGVISLALLLQIIGVATPGWIIFRPEEIKRNQNVNRPEENQHPLSMYRPKRSGQYDYPFNEHRPQYSEWSGSRYIEERIEKRGLWKVCECSCKEIVPYSEGTDAVRAFGVLGVIVMAVSAACGVLICFLSSQKLILSLAAVLAAVTGATFSSIEWAVFVGELPEPYRGHLGYSFGLTITATILSIIATILFILGRNAMKAA